MTKVDPSDPEKGSTKSDTLSGGSFETEHSHFARVQRIAGKWKIEQRGIERVPEGKRVDRSLYQVGTLWLSPNMCVTAAAIGILGPKVYELGFVDSCLTIIFVNILAIVPVCFFMTLGAKFGLRQMVLSRFWFGWYAVKFISFLNILACIGWAILNVILGAQLINAVNNNVPGYAGIIILAGITSMIGLFGYKAVHLYEKWSWIPAFIVFLIVAGEFGHSGAFVNIPMGRGRLEAASVLSFASAVFGYSTSWSVIAADFSVYQPENVSRVKLFLWAFAGLTFPIFFLELLGAAIGCAGVVNESYQVAYQQSGNGGLFGEVLQPPLGRFGDFCLIVLALASIAPSCPGLYSASLTLQTFTKLGQRVPRVLWSIVCTMVYAGIAIPAYSHLESVISNFLLIISYWLAIYEAIAFSEHFFFRHGLRGYDPDDHLKPGSLPPGLAASVAFCFGIFGAVMGMAQVWFTGPIGKKIGGSIGGDIGFELAFAFTFVTYNALRVVEKKYFCR